MNKTKLWQLNKYLSQERTEDPLAVTVLPHPYLFLFVIIVQTMLRSSS